MERQGCQRQTSGTRVSWEWGEQGTEEEGGRVDCWKVEGPRGRGEVKYRHLIRTCMDMAIFAQASGEERNPLPS